MMRNKNSIQIIFIVLFGCAVMAIVDALIKPIYPVKSVIKIFMFLLIPLGYSGCKKEISLKKFLLPGKKGVLSALLVGIAVYIVVFGTYLITKKVYDFKPIAGMLENGIVITKGTFLLASFYIAFINSLLEEFFFRGFSFLLFSSFAGRKLAYVFSSVMFAAYHIAIIIGWFSWTMFVLVMAGLAAGAVIFNYIDERYGNIYCSWMVHMFANFAINTIGFTLLWA